MDYLDLRRFCSTQRAVILPNVRMLNRAGEELSPVWGITPDACAVGAGVAVTAGRAVGAAVGAGDADGAGVGVTVGSGEGSGEGFGGSYVLALISWAAFNASPGAKEISVYCLASFSFQRLSSPSRYQ